MLMASVRDLCGLSTGRSPGGCGCRQGRIRVVGFAFQILRTLLIYVGPRRFSELSGASHRQKKKAGYPACSWLCFLKDYAYLFLLFVKIGAISPPCYALYYLRKSILSRLGPSFRMDCRGMKSMIDQIWRMIGWRLISFSVNGDLYFFRDAASRPSASRIGALAPFSAV